MKREIKFRAWDGTKYITFDNHQYDLIYNDISGWNVCPNVPNYKGEWTTGESSSTAESFILEQFTGLKDKNGKDIYEGDIMEYSIGNLEIEWGQFKGRLKEFPEHCDDLEMLGWCVRHGKLGLQPLDYSLYTQYSVIGNIHQNPELSWKQ